MLIFYIIFHEIYIYIYIYIYTDINIYIYIYLLHASKSVCICIEKMPIPMAHPTIRFKVHFKNSYKRDM